MEIYRFSGTVSDYKDDPSSKSAKALLGGKGAGLVMMAQQGLNVPPGFTITTDVCNQWRTLTTDKQRDKFMDKLMKQVATHMVWLMDEFGYTPLVSVRSGAPISMPGMMDTILNVGLTEDTFDGWSDRLGNRAAIDSYRRLIQMLGAAGYGVPGGVFDFQMAAVKKLYGVKSDTELTSDMLDNLLQRYRKVFRENKGFEFPDNDPVEQLRVAIRAVFDSWMNPRAIEYRKINKIDETMGTAVNVQAMVFGNMGEDSGTGVLFSRDPSTGENAMMGEYLTNAQGEDVVAGIRTPIDVNTMATKAKEFLGVWTDVHGQLVALCKKLEEAYNDMVDVEFTVQKGTLFVLQSRTGKRSARAAFKIAVDMVGEGAIDKQKALRRLSTEQFKVVRRPALDPKFKVKPNSVGLPACPGVVAGRPVFSSEEAVQATDPVILVTHETSPDDIAGMAKAVGILTKTGGATSHAAVVARAMDKTCVVGCTDLDIDALKSKAHDGLLTIDGTTGNVWFGVDVPVIDASDDPAVKTVMDWSMAILGAHEPAPVDLGLDRPHRLMAAMWWGSSDALDAVLAGIEELPYRTHIALDMASPKSHEQPGDSFLTNAFGAIPQDDFPTTIVSELVKRSQSLAGLTLVNVPSSIEGALVQSGYKVGGSATHTVPVAVPPDYAAFSILRA